MPKREVCPMCNGTGHILVLNWPEHCPKCKRTGYVKPEPTVPFGIPGQPKSTAGVSLGDQQSFSHQTLMDSQEPGGDHRESKG